MNLEATSTRETLAMMRLGATTRPEPSRREPGDAITDDRQRQVQKRRSLDQPHPRRQIEIDDGRLELGLARAVDQVHSERKSIARLMLNPIDRLLDRP